jgi:hypothetical protein
MHSRNKGTHSNKEKLKSYVFLCAYDPMCCRGIKTKIISPHTYTYTFQITACAYYLNLFPFPE